VRDIATNEGTAREIAARDASAGNSAIILFRSALLALQFAPGKLPSMRNPLPRGIRRFNNRTGRRADPGITLRFCRRRILQRRSD